MTSKTAAEQSRRDFASIKRRTLKRVGAELLTQREAIAKLGRSFVAIQKRFLRLDGTTYADWLAIAQPEWDEVLAAAKDDSVWDRLVDRCTEASS